MNLRHGVVERPTMGVHERAAVRERLKQIGVAIGHPKLTTAQLEALMRERVQLERALVGEES
jgi:hypothetical protein